MSVNAAESTTEQSTFPYKRKCPFSMPEEYGPMMEKGSVTKVSLITGLEVWAVTDYHGTTGLDAWYAPYQLFIDQIVLARGYMPQNFASRVFDGAGHSEDDWGRRVAIPLEFLLGPLSAPDR